MFFRGVGAGLFPTPVAGFENHGGLF